MIALSFIQHIHFISFNELQVKSDFDVLFA